MTALQIVPPVDGEVVYQTRDMMPTFDEPMKVGRALAEEWDRAGEPLVSWRGDWWSWTGRCWRIQARDELDSRVRTRLEDSWCERTSYGDHGTKTWIEPWAPTNRKVVEVVEAIRATSLLPELFEAGCDRVTGRPVLGRVATAGGFLDLSSRKVLPSNPRWFVTWALPFAPQATPQAPKRWLEFLDSLWGEDEAPNRLLQEWMGYLVSGRTDQQKAMLLIGEKRGGKGTILHVCQQLVGRENASSPTLAAMTQNFGLQTSIGKALIAVGDARLDGARGSSQLVERILSITGEDPLMVDRKNHVPWNGRLGARIMIASNEVPDFRDASGAVASRFLSLRMTQSFLGREDTGLKTALDEELPAILSWALDGLARLDGRGRFDQSMSAASVHDQMDAAVSPIKLFLDQACVVDSAAWVGKDFLFDAWSAWCARYRRGQSSPETMARALMAAAPGVAPTRLRVDGARVRRFTGIRISPEWLAELENQAPEWDARAAAARLRDRLLQESGCG